MRKRSTLRLPVHCVPNPEIAENIEKALKNFKKNWDSNEKIFEELCFCLLTSQSSAKQAIKAINLLKKYDLLDKGGFRDKEIFLKNVRFFRTKAKRLEEVQSKFPKNKIRGILMKNGLPSNPIKCREFLVKEVNGYGLKEASHFLRNIGFGDEIAILDRHVLKNLVGCEIIKDLPKSLTKKKYLEIEEIMRAFCKRNQISMSKLDLIFWSNETGTVLK